MISLSEKWANVLAAEPETGMGYQVASVVLNDGRRFDQVVVVGGRITAVRGCREVPFSEGQIAELFVTHDKWNFGADR
jgi:hypothetical protein